MSFLLLLVCLIFPFSAEAWTIEVKANPVKFFQIESDHLKVKSVLELTSETEYFGGLSSVVRKDGYFYTANDNRILFRLDPDDLTKVETVDFDFRSEKQRKNKGYTDSEGMTLDENGDLLVSFERKHRIVPYTLTGEIAGPDLKLPDDLGDLKYNGGIEAIELLRDGRLVILTEGRDADEAIFLWVREDGIWQKHVLPKIDGFQPTGLTQLPNSDDLILLERSFSIISGVKGRLSLLSPKNWHRGKVLAHLDDPFPVDNFEGVTAYKNEEGDTQILIVSDDNYNSFQRTLLVHMEMQ